MKRIVLTLVFLAAALISRATLITSLTLQSTPGDTDRLIGYRGSVDSQYQLPALRTYFAAGSQPFDSDLAAIALLTTTSYGRSALTLADAVAARTLFGVSIGSQVQGWSAKLDSLATVTGTGVLYYLDATGTPHALTIGTGLTLNTTTHTLVSAAGGGNMNTAVYDQDADGKIDSAAIATHTHTAAQISDSTAAGRALLTAADAAAQKSAIALNNVDNTSDANKPVSTAQAAAIALKASLSALAATNGSGPNAVNGLVDWSQLKGVPAGFADGTDDGAGGAGVSQTSEIVGVFSASATTTLARPSGSDFHTAFLTAGVGTGAYVRMVVLNTTNAPASGDQFRVVVVLPASSNPTVEIYSGATGGSPLSVIKNLSATADTVALDYIYVGSAWVLASSNATRIKDLPLTFTYAAPPSDGKIEVDSATSGIGQMSVPMQADWNASSGNAAILNKPTLIVTSAGAGDSGKVPKLDSSGKLDSSVIPTGAGVNATQIQSVNVANTAPTDTYVLKFNQSNNRYEPAPDATGGGGGTYGNAAAYAEFFDDFQYGWGMWTQGDAAGGSHGTGTNTGQHLGLANFIAGGNPGSSFQTGMGAKPGAGQIVFEAQVRFSALSGTISQFRLGFDGSAPNAAVGNGIWFDIAGSNALTLKCANGGTTSSVSLGTVTAGTWYTWKFVVNAAGTSIQAYVDGVATGTPLTGANIPTQAEPIGIHIRENGTPGTTFDIDWLHMLQTFTTAR